MMEYQKKQERQKIMIALPTIAAIIVIILALSFLIGPSIVSKKPDVTPPPLETLKPIDGEPKIYDTVLENAVKKQLGIDHAPTKSDMESLEKIDYTEETVTNLSGLEYAINLREIRLKIDLQSLDPIKNLQITKLTFLSDVSVQPLMEDISKLVHLQYIDLTDCGISIIGHLSEIVGLETLILDDNRISDLKYVPEMKILSTLSIKNCNIKDINVLVGCKMLKNLYVDNNKIEDISPADYIYSLENFTYEGNPVKIDK